MPNVRYSIPAPGPFSVSGSVRLPKGPSAADLGRMNQARKELSAEASAGPAAFFGVMLAIAAMPAILAGIFGGAPAVMIVAVVWAVLTLPVWIPWALYRLSQMG